MRSRRSTPGATVPFMPVLVDSSLWVHQLRKGGDPSKRDRVNALLESGEAAWCPVVRLELWRGVTNEAERKTLRRYGVLLPDYEISAEVWDRSIRLADHARASGVTVPLADLLISACAKIHGLDVAHDDAHFDELAKLEAS
jgi:predicted nucleic acid-binding protein